jgi:restriction system protein
MLLCEAFRRQGYTVKENSAGGPDGGIDLVLTKDNETTLVQCKNFAMQAKSFLRA